MIHVNNVTHLFLKNPKKYQCIFEICSNKTGFKATVYQKDKLDDFVLKFKIKGNSINQNLHETNKITAIEKAKEVLVAYMDTYLQENNELFQERE